MNILLVCSAGMSTSLLVQKMEKSASEKDIDVRIWAVSVDEARTNLEEADVLLLGPQVRYKLSQFKVLAEEKGIPIDVINPLDYGVLNGEKVLEFAMSLKK
ncbi:PTS sugar transporter subunit IIB [Bacillus sp. CECT 9360]|uniref:PTS sugar transporter subunit IIB n=1 Tax=Bacillus sp. CECT 9360 TaxID=2845821 RepID=UPI001E36E4E2|nr:PTS sugar transporter subunit IIB [Bacillus sp. CECT 9360]CAH0346471.1 PTS system cellobiose-specific EIIB component [Bacillus sp. CECT 9360]